MNVRVPFNFTTWNKVVYTSGYVITYIIKTTEPNHLILILNLANKSYIIINVNFCHLLAWFKNYDPLKVGVNSFWDTLYKCNLYTISYNPTLALQGSYTYSSTYTNSPTSIHNKYNSHNDTHTPHTQNHTAYTPT